MADDGLYYPVELKDGVPKRPTYAAMTEKQAKQIVQDLNANLARDLWSKKKLLTALAIDAAKRPQLQNEVNVLSEIRFVSMREEEIQNAERDEFLKTSTMIPYAE